MPSQARGTHKRQRFLESAARLIHHQGYAQTTLADVAAGAQLPHGSLYYYFRSKDEIVAAIVAERLHELDQRIATWERNPDPRARLACLIDVWVEDADTDARYGCPIGSLCYELAKMDPPGHNRAAQPLGVLLQWSCEQFRALGAGPDDASSRSLHLLSTLQGVSLIANAFHDPAMILRETTQLHAWLAKL